MRPRAGILTVAAVAGLLLGMFVGGGHATASAAGLEPLNGYQPPTCTTSNNVTLGGVCEDLSEPSAPLTDTGNSWDTGTFGTMFGWLFGQVFRLVTDNIAVLLIWLAAWLTFVVFSFLGRKSGADDGASRAMVSYDGGETWYSRAP